MQEKMHNTAVGHEVHKVHENQEQKKNLNNYLRHMINN